MMVSPLFLGSFYPILFILAGNEDMHEISKEFEITPDPATSCGVSCPCACEKIPIGLQWEKKRYLHLFSAVYDPILMILAGNEDIHKSLDEFELVKIWRHIAELGAIERLKINVSFFRSRYWSNPF